MWQCGKYISTSKCLHLLQLLQFEMHSPMCATITPQPQTDTTTPYPRNSNRSGRTIPPRLLEVQRQANDRPTCMHQYQYPFWQDEVKAGLDRDVSPRHPVTWCHRMVICAKKAQPPRHQGNTSYPVALGKSMERLPQRAKQTFITPWGRYRYRTASTSDTRRYDEITPKKTKCVGRQH